MQNYQMNVQSIDDMSWIVEAAQEIMSASEADFESICSKRWYKRLWETVTFAKDNQIKMAKGVSSLSKLQEIMIRLMVVLSQNSTEIFDAVKQSSDLISKLSITDALLAKQIDRIIFGGTAQIDFADLDREKKIAIASLLNLADSDEQKNTNARMYLGSILRSANIPSFDNTVNVNAVESLNREEQELLYRMIMINRYLMKIDYSKQSDVIDWISINNRRKDEIRADVQTTAASVEPEFFITYFEKNGSFIEEVSGEDIWFENFGFEKTSNDDTREESVNDMSMDDCEEIVLSSIIHIPQGETYLFENKIIHVQSFINCEGTLKFYNCVIHYGENKQPCEIKINNKADISLTKCRIEGHSHLDRSIFFKFESKSTVHFSSCYFLNCCSFIKTTTQVVFEDCVVKNFGVGFIDSTSCYKEEEAVIIQDTTFVTDNPPEYIINTQEYRNDRIIEAKAIKLMNCTMIGTLRIESADEANQIDRDWPKIVCADYIAVDNVHFKGVPAIFKGCGSIRNSVFEECYGIISQTWIPEKLEINDCTFVKCTLIGACVPMTSIMHCKFINCFNCLISGGFQGKTNIEYCEFINWSADQENDCRWNQIYSTVFPKAMIALERAKGKEYGINKVNNCVFEGMSAHQYFLIMGNIHEKIDGLVAYVENCSFSKCTTERDSGKIIKEHDHYFGLFNKRVDVRTISIADNCRGLDTVIKVCKQ